MHDRHVGKHYTESLNHTLASRLFKSTWEEEHATPGPFAMDAATAEYQVRHRCRQSALKRKTLLSSSVELNVEHCTLTNTCMQRAGPARTAGQNNQASRESKHARAQRWVHNDMKREWLCVIDDALEIMPWQTPKCGVAYSSCYVLLLIMN